MKLPFWLAAVLLATATSAPNALAEMKITHMDEACAQESIRRCVNASMPQMFCGSGSGNIDLVWKDDFSSATSPSQIGKFVKDNYASFSGDAITACSAPYKFVKDQYGAAGGLQCKKVWRCEWNGELIERKDDVVSNSGRLAINGLPADSVTEFTEQCRSAVRNVGLYGGAKCLRQASYPDGSFLEDGLLQALNKIAEQIKGFGERVGKK